MTTNAHQANKLPHSLAAKMGQEKPVDVRYVYSDHGATLKNRRLDRYLTFDLLDKYVAHFFLLLNIVTGLTRGHLVTAMPEKLNSSATGECWLL